MMICAMSLCRSTSAGRWPRCSEPRGDYAAQTGRRVSIEYALIRDVNDQPWRADLLGRLLRGKLAHVNLIPLNPTPGSRWDASPKPVEREFVRRLREAGVATTVRDTRGREIDGACGQLAAAERARAGGEPRGSERRHSDESGTAFPAAGAAARLQGRRGGRVPRPGRGHTRRRADRRAGRRAGGARRRLPGALRRIRRVAGRPAPGPGGAPARRAGGTRRAGAGVPVGGRSRCAAMPVDRMGPSMGRSAPPTERPPAPPMRDDRPMGVPQMPQRQQMPGSGSRTVAGYEEPAYGAPRGPAG